MQVLKITATGLARTGFTDVSGVTVVAAAANATVRLTDALTDTGNDSGGASAIPNTSESSDMHGTQHVTGVFVTLTGVDAVAYVYYA